jgi:hypothetical protein
MKAHKWRVVSLLGLVGLSVLSAGGQDFYGEWSQPWLLKPEEQQESTEGIHSVLLHTGKVLCIDSSGPGTSPGWADIVLVDPQRAGESDAVQTVLDNWGDWPHHLFCSGHTQLADGTVLFSGGGLLCDDGGAQQRTTFYTPNSGSAL